MYKASSGSIEHSNIFKVANINSTLKFLREKNFWVYGFSSEGSEDFTKYDWKGKNILKTIDFLILKPREKQRQLYGNQRFY